MVVLCYAIFVFIHRINYTDNKKIQINNYKNYSLEELLILISKFRSHSFHFNNSDSIDNSNLRSLEKCTFGVNLNLKEIENELILLRKPYVQDSIELDCTTKQRKTM